MSRPNRAVTFMLGAVSGAGFTIAALAVFLYMASVYSPRLPPQVTVVNSTGHRVSEIQATVVSGGVSVSVPIARLEPQQRERVDIPFRGGEGAVAIQWQNHTGAPHRVEGLGYVEGRGGYSLVIAIHADGSATLVESSLRDR